MSSPAPNLRHSSGTWSNTIAKIAFITLTAIVFCTAIYLIRIEINAIILGTLLASVLMPVHRKVLHFAERVNFYLRHRVFRQKTPLEEESRSLYEKKVKNQARRQAAIISVALVFLIIVIPFSLFLVQLAKQGMSTLRTTAIWLDDELPKQVPRAIEIINRNNLARKFFMDLQIFRVSPPNVDENVELQHIIPPIPSIDDSVNEEPDAEALEDHADNAEETEHLEDADIPESLDSQASAEGLAEVPSPAKANPQEELEGVGGLASEELPPADSNETPELVQTDSAKPAISEEDELPRIDPQQVTAFLMNISRTLLSKAFAVIMALLSKAWLTIFNFFMMLFVMFFIFYDGENIMNYARNIIPLGTEEQHQVIQRIKEVSSSIAFSILGTALCQTIVAMIIFRIVGIPALFWGVMLGMCSIIPVVGTTLIWIPASLYLFATGQTWQGWFVLCSCGIIVANLDNLLRPLIMKKTGKTGMSYLVLFFAILGGLQTFGLIGIIYGPLIFGICGICLLLFSTRFKRKADSIPQHDERGNTE